MGRLAAAVPALVLAASLASAEVAIRVSGDQVDVSATAAPLADVLDDLAEQTGMEIEYEGSPPRHRVTLALEGRSPTEAVLGILEGQGLNYALIADPTGTQVQTLIVAGAAGKGTISGAGAPAPPTRGRRPVMAPPAAGPGMDEYDDMEEDDPFEDPALLDDEFPEDDAAQELEPGGVPPGAAPIPAAGPMPFPGGRQVFPASPFTPQPVYPQPPPAPGAPGSEEGGPQPAQSPP